MNDKEWLDRVVHGCKVYNETRLHTDFQEDEVLKFVEWLHKQYGYSYEKPQPRHRNTPR
jgi:hypothetical protein